MMKAKRFLAGRLALAAGTAAILILAGCASRTPKPSVPEAPAVPAKTPPAGIILEYKMPAGQILRYQDHSETLEASDVMGQSIESKINSTSICSFQAKGRKEQNHLLGVTIDDMSLTINSPRGDLSPDMSPVKGKSFDMVLSPIGTEVDVSGAESITYQFVTGPRNVAAGFKTFFPDLPGKPVKVGDSWPSSFAIDEKSGATNMHIEFQAVNTLEGFENVDGMECARVSSKVTGTVSGTGSQQGADLLFKGTLKGGDIWHFAPKEGLFVKSTSEVVSEMTISVSGPQTMTIPTTQTRKSEVKLAGR